MHDNQPIEWNIFGHENNEVEQGVIGIKNICFV